MDKFDDRDHRSQKSKGANIIVLGVMGSGKTTVGERLAYFLGYGFIDLDKLIEKRQKKSIADIFAKDGEEAFRRLESEALRDLLTIRSHVISVGGGIVTDDESWEQLKNLGRLVWINTSPAELARRFVMKPDEIRKRPLLSDLVEIEDKEERQKKLMERLSSFIEIRRERYGVAEIVIDDHFTTPETCAQLLARKIQVKELNHEQKNENG